MKTTALFSAAVLAYLGTAVASPCTIPEVGECQDLTQEECSDGTYNGCFWFRNQRKCIYTKQCKDYRPTASPTTSAPTTELESYGCGFPLPNMCEDIEAGVCNSYSGCQKKGRKCATKRSCVQYRPTASPTTSAPTTELESYGCGFPLPNMCEDIDKAACSGYSGCQRTGRGCITRGNCRDYRPTASPTTSAPTTELESYGCGFPLPNMCEDITKAECGGYSGCQKTRRGCATKKDCRDYKPTASPTTSAPTHSPTTSAPTTFLESISCAFPEEMTCEETSRETCGMYSGCTATRRGCATASRCNGYVPTASPTTPVPSASPTTQGPTTALEGLGCGFPEGGAMWCESLEDNNECLMYSGCRVANGACKTISDCVQHRPTSSPVPLPTASPTVICGRPDGGCGTVDTQDECLNKWDGCRYSNGKCRDDLSNCPNPTAAPTTMEPTAAPTVRSCESFSKDDCCTGDNRTCDTGTPLPDYVEGAICCIVKNGKCNSRASLTKCYKNIS